MATKFKERRVAHPMALRSALLSLGCLCLGLGGGSRAQDTVPDPAAAVSQFTSMEALDDQHRLAPGDRVAYRVIEDKDEPKSLLVTDSGELEVPYLGRVKAAEKNCRQLAGEIKSALEKELYYQATVILAVEQLNKKRGNVYLVGQVRVSGAVEIPSDEVLTLTKAILRVGGFADFADKKRVKVIRKPGPGETQNKTFVVDIAAILEKGKTEGDLALEPGDLIYVPSRAFNF
jgi:polysaccharide export outer membrane protein